SSAIDALHRSTAKKRRWNRSSFRSPEHHSHESAAEHDAGGRDLAGAEPAVSYRDRCRPHDGCGRAAAPWQYLFGVYPPYWVFRAYWEASSVGMAWWLYLGAAVITHALAIVALHRRLLTVMYR
ncbi:MAG: hypothetical protein ACE5HT_13475, partial [Gemmatimonadales bacterium]